MQAAMGVAQLERLDEFIAIKRKMGEKYTALLKDVEQIALPVVRTGYAENIYWVYGTMLKPGWDLDADKVMAALGKAGVGTRPFFWNMHEQPVFNEMGLFLNEKYPVAEQMARMGFYLPSGMALTDGQLETAVDKFKKIMADG
jgi:perosamine synthetase